MASDQTADVTDLVVIRRTVPATVTRAFDAWTDPASIARWAAPGTSVITHAAVDLRIGGRFEQHMRAANGFERRVAGTYLEISAPYRLVYTWRWELPPEDVESRVTVEFRDIGSATEVIVTHALLGDDTSRVNHAKGWNGCLDRYVELFAAAI